MSSTKTVTVWGFLCKQESSYGSGASLSTSTDGVMLAKEAYTERLYAKTGERAPAAGAAGENIGAVPSGSYMDLPLEIEGRGAGVAYDSSHFVEHHGLLLASGLAAVVGGGSGTEKVTYTPTTPQLTAQASLAASAYARGELYPLTAIYCDWDFTIEPGGFWMHQFKISGLCGDPSDVSLPAIVYKSLVPAKAESMAVTVNPGTVGGSSFTAGHWTKIGFKLSRVLSPRMDGNTTTHLGWTPGRRTPRLTITFEQEALASFNPVALMKAASSLAVSFGMGTGGTGAYNRQEFSMAQAQIVKVGPGNEGATGTVELTFAGRMSTPAANDDFSYVTK